MNEYKVYPKQFLSTNMLVDKNRCFVIMPFEEKLNYVYGKIKKELSSKGFICNRIDEIGGSTPIISKILNEMLRSRYIIADLTDCNPNVFYELGVAHCFKDAQNIIILKQKGSKIPFDVTHLTYIEYERDNLFFLTSSILDAINETKYVVDLENALELRGIISTVKNCDYSFVDFLQVQLSDDISFLTRILLNEHIQNCYSENDIECLLSKYQNTFHEVVILKNSSIIEEWIKCYSEILISCDMFNVSQKFVESFLGAYMFEGLLTKANILEAQTEFAVSLANSKKYISIVIPWIISYLSHSQSASIDLNRYKVEAYLMTEKDKDINQIIINAVFDKNCYVREHISDIIGEKKLSDAAENLCTQLRCEENFFVAVSIIEALGKINCQKSLSIINDWVQENKNKIIEEKQFFVLKHVRIVLSKLVGDNDLDVINNFDNEFQIYLKDYFIL